MILKMASKEQKVFAKNAKQVFRKSYLEDYKASLKKKIESKIQRMSNIANKKDLPSIKIKEGFIQGLKFVSGLIDE